MAKPLVPCLGPGNALGDYESDKPERGQGAETQGTIYMGAMDTQTQHTRKTFF